jgi:hypothetical protein
VTSKSNHALITLEIGGSKRALPVRPAISHAVASVTSESSLSVLGFMLASPGRERD